MLRAVLPFLALLAAGSAAAVQPARPNIVFIFSDDHSTQSIGAYRQWLGEFSRTHGITPHIDRLAAEGALFTRSYCGNSLCSPSRATVLSGLHSHANGVTRLEQGLRPGVWTFPPALRAAGYQTALIGKWHLRNEPEGFDFHRILPGQGHYWQPVFRGPAGLEETVKGYATDIITEKSLAWLRTRDRTKPFLLLCHHKAPHGPWEPPERHYDLLADTPVPEPPTLFDDYTGRASGAARQKMEIGRDLTLERHLKVLPAGKIPERMTPAQAAAWQRAYGPRNAAFLAAPPAGAELVRWKYQAYMKNYLRCAKAVDDSVGRILDWLRAEGLEENTVVIYASDQGFFNGEHGWYDKRWIYDESLRMPLIVRWPGVTRPGTRVTAMVQNIDHAPTLAEIAGVTAPAGLHGRSLVPLLRGETPPDWRRSIYYHYYDPGHNMPRHDGIRTERHTLAHYPATDEWELFDHERDPHQLRSVFSDPAYAGVRAELQAERLRLRARYAVPTDEPRPPGKGKTR
jgi:N-acetylglucosamine-6-sulfatase